MCNQIGTFIQQINLSNYGNDYLDKREKLLEKIGPELKNLEHMEEIRKILVNAKDDELEIVEWITKTNEYEEVPITQKAEYFLFKVACTGILRRVDLFGEYLKVRDKIAVVIGRYNTYLMEEILGFQYLCMSISMPGIYRFWKIMQVVRTRENMGPFLNPNIYLFTDEIFCDLLLFCKSTFLDNNIQNDQKKLIVEEHIELLSMIDCSIKLKAIYYKLCIYSYSDKEILETIKGLSDQ